MRRMHMTVPAAMIAGCGESAGAQREEWEKVRIAGDRITSGIYDPSLKYGPEGGTGWMAYSVVHGNRVSTGSYVSAHLAKSADRGALRHVLHLRPQADFLSVRGGGKADYDEHNTAGGILVPQVNLSAYPEIGQVFRTRRRIVGP